MTSLSKQLQKLAIPGQPSFQQLTEKKRTPSFLFQPEEVGDVTVDTIFLLGQNGLEELISMDPSFVEFENHLFSDSCKGYERTMQTKEVLEDVDKKLAKFLRLLSPYFMLKPAHKCLEWLVRVFRVHCHNVDALMECVLPYYQTLLFVRVVQLIPLNDHALSKWAWLKPVKKSGSRLSKLTLTQHCLSDLSFFVFVCECVSASLKAGRHFLTSNVSRPSISLYTSTALNVLETASPVTEELVMRLMPYVKKGLKSENSEFKASTYMIISQLAVVVEMEDILVESLVDLICKSLCESLLKEGLCCIAVLCHAQRPARLSHKSLQYLHQLHTLVPTLSTIHHTHYITPLITVLMVSLFSASLEEHEGGEEEGRVIKESSLSLLQEILDEVELEQLTALKFIKQMLVGGIAALEACYMAGDDAERVDWARSVLTSLTSSLDAKYPTAMDKALEETVTAIYSKGHAHSSGKGGAVDTNTMDGQVTLLQELVSSSFPQNSRHQVLVGVGSTLCAGVHHPNQDMRAAAFTQLGGALEKQAPSGVVDDFVTSSLLGGLADESPGVVQAVLNLGHKVLVAYLPLDKLVSSLTSFLVKKPYYRCSSQWQEACLSAVGILTSKSLSATPHELLNDVVMAIVPLLYIDSRASDFARRVAKRIGRSNCASNHPVLEALAGLSSNQVWLERVEQGSHGDKQKLAAANALVFSVVGEGMANLKVAQLSDIVTKLMGVVCSTPPESHVYFTCMAVVISLLRTTPTSSPDTQHQIILQLLQHIHEDPQALQGGGVADTAVLDGGLVTVFLPVMEEPSNKVAARRLLFTCALQAVCNHMVIPCNLSSSMWLDLTKTSSQEQLYYELLVSLFSLLVFLVDSQQGGKGHDATKRAGKGLTTGKLLLQSFFKRYFSECGTLLRFLGMIWTAPAGMELEYGAVLDPVLQGCSLGIGCAYIQSLSGSAAVALIAEHCPIVPSLLIPLASPNKLVRERALDCLQSLQDACVPVFSATHSRKSPVQPPPSALVLLQGIAKVRLEVSMDPTQINNVLRKLFETVTADPPPTPSKRRSKRIAGAAGGGAVTPTSAEGCGHPRTWLDGLVGHVVGLGMPCYVQNQVLRLLDQVDDVRKLLSLVPLLCANMEDILKRQKLVMDVEDPLPEDGHSTLGLSSDVEVTLSLLVQCFSPVVASSLPQQPHLFQLLLQLLKTDTPLTHTSLPSSPQQLAMKQLTPAFFEQLGSHSLQLEVLRCLLDILVETKSSDVTASIKHMIGEYSLTVDLLAEEIQGNLKDLGKGELSLPTPKKRRRATRSSEAAPPPSSDLASGIKDDKEGVVNSMWRRVAVVLELVESSCHLLPKAHLLVPVFFNCLSRTLEVAEEERVSLEYVQQLLLSCLLAITEHYSSHDSGDKESLSESQFSVEHVVQCIRLSSSPQTHQHALLLLTSAANIFPGLVLHNIMPIFTFMGAQLLHQDDQYSFQVITSTIDTVIPALIKSGSLLSKTPLKKPVSKRRGPGGSVSSQSTVEGIVTEVIRIFVDALPHIPDHRKLPLFGHLLRTMGPRNYLHAALGIMTEKRVGYEELEEDKQQMVEETKLDPGLIVGVAQQFSPADQIHAAGKLAEYISHLPDVKPSTTYKLRQLPPSVSSLFNVATHSDQQLQSFKLSSLSLLCTLLSHPDFLSQVSSLRAGEVEEEVLNVLRVMLKYVSYLSSSEVTQEGKAKKGSIGHKCLKCSYSVLDKVTSLLLPASFLDVMVQLVGVTSDNKEGGSGKNDVQKRALEILANKLDARTLKFRKGNVDSLLDLGRVCIDVGASNATPTQSRQTALKCVRLITGQLSNKRSHDVQQLAEQVMQLLSSSDADDGAPPLSVLGSCLLCVPEFCQVLGPHLIPLLPSLLPLIVRHLESSVNNRRSERLVLDALSALHALISTLPNFISSYVPHIIIKLCRCMDTASDSQESTEIKTVAASVRVDVSQNIPIRNLLLSYQQCYSEVKSCGKGSVLALLAILGTAISRLTKEDIRNHEDLLCDIITTSLDYRATHTQDVSSMASVGAVEEGSVQLFTDLSVKLSEPQFRQFFLKLLDWATNSSASQLRLITFYQLASKAAEKLKNLFLLFAGHFFSNAVNLLDISHSQKEGLTLFIAKSDGEDVSEEEKELAVSHCCLLVDSVLQCLSKCFLYDKTEFVTRERFDAILQPLVSQVTNMVGGKGRSMERTESNVAECVSHLGMALSKEDLWQKLNYQLLLKTRHKKSYVRLGTLKVLKQFYFKLGEEFEVLVPQTIPFLTELLEDDCEEVEALAQEILGNRV